MISAISDAHPIFEKITKALSDSMANIIDNTICFTMIYSDYGYEFDLLKNEDKVIGFRFIGIGAWINTPQTELGEACTNRDLQKVKELLTTCIPEKRATISYEDFYKACTNKHKEVIKYLLSSPELSEHSQINNKEDNRFTTPFHILCNSNPQIVKQLISELPENVVKDVRKFLENDSNNILNKEDLINSLNSREPKEQILKIRSTAKLEPNISTKLKK